MSAATVTPGMRPLEEEVDASAVQHRTLRGVATMALRELVIKLLALVGWIILARLLEPSVFGLFAIANFSVNVFVLFSEVGLGAALVRSHEALTRKDLDGLFTLQLVAVAAVALAMLAVAPAFGAVYGLPGAGWVLAALAGSLVLVSLRTVPAVVAQRRLQYTPLVWADVSGQTVYWVTAVAAALLGLGVWSVVLAVLFAGLAGTLAIYLFVGYRPALAFDRASVRRSLLFSVSYQSQLASSWAKYMLFPALGGLAYGPTTVGYATWAHQLSVIPVQVSQLVSRVSFSAFARLQSDREALTRMLRSTLRWTCKLSFPAFAVVAGLAPQIVDYIYSARWRPALPLLYLLVASAALSSVASVLVSALYSLGKGPAGLRIAVAWAALTWLVALALFLGGVGGEAMGIAFVVASVAALAVTLYELRELGAWRLVQGVWLPGASGLVLMAVLLAAGPALVHGLVSLLAVGALAGLVGLAINIVPEWRSALAAVRSLVGSRRLVPRRVSQPS